MAEISLIDLHFVFNLESLQPKSDNFLTKRIEAINEIPFLRMHIQL